LPSRLSKLIKKDEKREEILLSSAELSSQKNQYHRDCGGIR
jgi:hypothetical protein